MRSQSLFGEIVLRTAANDAENIATESLLYILLAYPTAWPALRGVLGLGGIKLPATLAFKTQVSAEQDEGIPDLVGADSEGDSVLIVEVKFWAALTPNQPATYLRRLPSNKPALLVVIAPGQRFEYLWSKLVERSDATGLPLGPMSDHATEIRVAPVRPNNSVVLTSWRSMLSIFLRDAETRADAALLGDVEQLHGLCARMDSEAFLPLTPNDLSRRLGRRVQQLVDLVDDVVSELARSHGASSLTTGGSQSTYGRFFMLGGLGFFFSYAPSLWARYGETPMWLSVSEVVNGRWVPSPWIRESLAQALAAKPGRLFDSDGRATIAVELPVGVDRQKVMADVVTQIAWVAHTCNQARAT